MGAIRQLCHGESEGHDEQDSGLEGQNPALDLIERQMVGVSAD